ncbi:MAG: PQQ-binding-like beta-propeller repeat protein, partial [Armatimonadota bacterium]
MMNNSMKAVGALALVAACVLATASVWGADARHEALARQIIADTGVKGGLVVHVGCGDGKLTAALRQNDGYLVHGLDADPANVERAREHIRSLGLYGKVSAEQWDSEYLPYTDNLVNLLVLDGAADVRMREVRRVLAPEGAAYVEIGDQWMTNTNPRPGEIDEWTHFLHDATNNAVAHDALVGPPKHLQWIGSPKWARSHDHLASVSAVVSANGRIFYIADEGPTATVALPTAWFLVGRDAFSGVTLWRRAVRPWEGHLRGFRSGPSEIPRRLVAVDETVYVTLGYGKPVTALDAATGTTLRTYKGTAGADEILYHEGVLYLTAGDAAAQLADAAKRRGITLPPPSKDVLAVKADTGALLWRKSDDDTRGLMPLTLAVADGRVFFQNTKAVVCLDARSGERIWRTERRANLKRPAWSAPTLVVYEDVVLSAERGESTRVGGETLGSGDVGWLVSSSGGDAPVGDLIAFSAETGRELWRCEAREAYNAPPDVLVAGGLVWT